MPDVDPQTDKNRDDIAHLTAAMAAQVEINKTAGERHTEMMNVMGKTLDKLDKVSDQVGQMAVIQANLTSVTEKANQALADARIAGHDAKDAKNALQVLPGMQKEIAAIKEWKDAAAGVYKGVKGSWSVLIAVGGGFAFLVGTALTVCSLLPHVMGSNGP